LDEAVASPYAIAGLHYAVFGGGIPLNRAADFTVISTVAGRRRKHPDKPRPVRETVSNLFPEFAV